MRLLMLFMLLLIPVSVFAQSTLRLDFRVL